MKEFDINEREGKTMHETKRSDDNYHSPRHKNHLTRQQKLDQHSTDKKNNFGPSSKQDGDLESLFDAGSKREASVKKEQMKSEKLKDHLRKSAEKQETPKKPSTRGPEGIINS